MPWPRPSPWPPRQTGSLPQANSFAALPGLGARGVVDGQQAVVGREKLLRDRGIEIGADIGEQCAAWERAGCTAVLVGLPGRSATTSPPSRWPPPGSATR